MEMIRRPWRLLVLGVLLASACGGGGGGGSDDDAVSSGVTANFVADTVPSCPTTSDTLSLREVSTVGSTVTLGLEVSDCDSSMLVFGVTFDIAFDPRVMQCASANPCSAGTLLTAPLATSVPHCVCDNTSGELIGGFSKAAPGTGDAITPGGSEDIVRIAMRATQAGLGRMDLTNGGSQNGTSLVRLDGSGQPVAIGGVAYAGGAVTAQ